jgi:predicted transcriptional regulator
MDIILAIKPKYAELIYSGEKEWEFRKSFPKKFDIKKDIIFLYETAPISRITGWIKLDKILNVWYNWSSDTFRDKNDNFNYIPFADALEMSKTTEDEMDKYFKNRHNLFFWHVKNFKKSISNHIIENPPQSYRYLINRDGLKGVK